MSILDHAHIETLIRLVQTHQPWSMGVTLEEGEQQLLLGLVKLAGFGDCATLEQRQLFGRYTDTGEKYPINRTCSYAVLLPDKSGHSVATKWLDHFVSAIIHYKEGAKDSIGLVKYMSEWFLRTKCFVPIQLTPEGEMLSEYPRSSPLEHASETDSVSSTVGVHLICLGWVDRKQVSSEYDVLVCRSCALRVYIPKVIKTWGELRKRSLAKFALAAMK